MTSCISYSEIRINQQTKWSSSYLLCFSIHRSLFYSISVTGSGGALFSTKSGVSLQITNSAFSSCCSSGKGGGIFMENSDDISISTSCSFRCLATDRGQFFSIEARNSATFYIGTSSITKSSPNYDGDLHTMRVFGGTQYCDYVNSTNNYIKEYGTGICFMGSVGNTISYITLYNNKGDLTLELSNTGTAVAQYCNLVSNSNNGNYRNYLVSGLKMNLDFNYCCFYQNSFPKLFGAASITRSATLSNCRYDDTNGITTFSTYSCIYSSTLTKFSINHEPIEYCLQYWTTTPKMTPKITATPKRTATFKPTQSTEPSLVFSRPTSPILLLIPFFFFLI